MDNGKLMQGVIVKIAVGVFGSLTVAVLLLAVFNDRGWLQVHAQADKFNALESEIKNLETQNQQITRDIEALRHDPNTIEKFAREELQLVKPGEIILLTPESN